MQSPDSGCPTVLSPEDGPTPRVATTKLYVSFHWFHKPISLRFNYLGSSKACTGAALCDHGSGCAGQKKTASRLPDPPDWVRFFRLSVIAEIVHKSAQGCTSRKRVQRPPVASQEGAHWRRRARAWKWRRRSKNPRPVGLIRWKLCINLHKDAQAEKGSDDHSLLLGSVETFSDEVSEAETAL